MAAGAAEMMWEAEQLLRPLPSCALGRVAHLADSKSGFDAVAVHCSRLGLGGVARSWKMLGMLHQ